MSRRLVAVLFLDLVGWTRLAERVDAEPLQLICEKYYEICSTVVREQGGIIEKFIGDAIMAVFGAERSQEDDALRALRTAFEIRARVGLVRDLGAAIAPLEIHCGIAAGEALVSHSPHAGIRVVGDVVNLAARLQSVATAGEIVVNEIAAHLARGSFTLDPMDPLTLKGKAEPVLAWRVTGEDVADPADGRTRMVDRWDERTRIREAFQSVTNDRRSQLITVTGPPGIGKSRLVRQAMRELGVAAIFATCPPYGSNGNYTTLLQVLEALADATRMSEGRISSVLSALSGASQDRPGVEEISWAARELLATAAAEKPLVVVWDGLEWAGQSLLRLIGDLAESLRDYPLLMVCVGRSDVPWPGQLGEHHDLTVGALAPADCAQLASEVAEVMAHDTELLERITRQSAGNPLFIRLLLESAALGATVDHVPPTVTAMVGAMIDRLPDEARHVLGAASVVGTSFTLEHLSDLVGSLPGADIDILADRQLICVTSQPGEYRFVQQPVHEVAYGRLEKELRLAWHKRLAEREVNRAFHAEAAVRLLRELRPGDESLPQLAGYAAQALLHEGTAALRQRDLLVATGLLERSLNLAPSGSQSVVAVRLSDALLLSGDTLRAAEVVAGLDDPSCVVQQRLVALRLGHATCLTDLGDGDLDPLARCRLEQLRMLIHLRDGRFGEAEQAVCAALEYARAVQDAYEEERLLAALCEVRQWSPASVEQRLSLCTELAERFAADRFLLVPVLAARARCLALLGDHDGVRAALAEAGSAVHQLRLTMGRILVDQATGVARSLAGDHAEAERHFRWAAGALEQAGHQQTALTMRVMAAREKAYAHPDREPEVGALLDRCAEMELRGRLLCLAAAARHGLYEGIEDVLSLLESTDDPCLRGDVYFDLAQAQRRLNNDSDADVLEAAAADSYASIGAVREWS